jgi:hypothetical protein
LATPRSSRQSTPSAIDDLHLIIAPADEPHAAAGYRAAI